MWRRLLTKIEMIKVLITLRTQPRINYKVYDDDYEISIECHTSTCVISIILKEKLKYN